MPAFLNLKQPFKTGRGILTYQFLVFCSLGNKRKKKKDFLKTWTVLKVPEYKTTFLKIVFSGFHSLTEVNFSSIHSDFLPSSHNFVNTILH